MYVLFLVKYLYMLDLKLLLKRSTMRLLCRVCELYENLLRDA